MVDLLKKFEFNRTGVYVLFRRINERTKYVDLSPFRSALSEKLIRQDDWLFQLDSKVLVLVDLIQLSHRFKDRAQLKLQRGFVLNSNTAPVDFRSKPLVREIDYSDKALLCHRWLSPNATS